jgi:predicted phosphoribosyltransferase
MDRDRFADRADAGRSVAALLGGYAGRDDVVVLGLPRGGVPVAAEIAAALGAELDVLVVRKLGVPSHPELAMGAIADIGPTIEVVTNDAVIGRLGITPVDFDRVYRSERQELQRRVIAYRGSRAAVVISGRVVIVVDDGLATGATMRAAVAAVRRQQPARLVVAVPVGSRDTCEMLRRQVDDVVCARHPEPFRAVHQGYRDFSQTPDREVLGLLARAAAAPHDRRTATHTSRAAQSAAVPSSRQPGTVNNPSTVNRPSDGR